MIQEGVVFAFGYWTVKPGNEDIFLEKWQKFAEWTINHVKGARWVYIVRDQEKNNKFISFGPWDSLDSIAEWRLSSKFRSAFIEFETLCDDIEPRVLREVNHIKR